MWPDCHCSGVGILENCSTLNPLNSPCTVVLLKTLEQSSTKGLSRDVASYHEACFHKGQIRQEIYSMTELSLPKIRVLKYTERAENDLLWHCQDHLTRWKRNSWCATWQEAEWRKKPGKPVIKTRPTLMFHHLKQQLFPLFHSKLQVCSCSIKNSRMWLYWVWNEQMLAKNSRFQVNKLKTGQPQPTPSFPSLTCWYSWQTSGWASVLAICWRCGLRRGLEQPPSTAARTMRGAQGCEEE